MRAKQLPNVRQPNKDTDFGNQAYEANYPSVAGKRRNPLKRTRGLRSASRIA
jgi:hypothetical protein